MLEKFPPMKNLNQEKCGNTGYQGNEQLEDLQISPLHLVKKVAQRNQWDEKSNILSPLPIHTPQIYLSYLCGNCPAKEFPPPNLAPLLLPSDLIFPGRKKQINQVELPWYIFLS